MHSWSDPVRGQNGMTYKDLWNQESFSRQLDYKRSGANPDCADFCIQQLVDFASDNKLPIYFEDYKADGVDPTFSNDAFGYTSKSGDWVSIDEGDTEALVSAIQRDYGASDLFNNRKLTTVIAGAKRSGEGFAYDNLEGFQGIGSGSLIGVKWKSGAYHSQTVSWLNSATNPIKIGLFNASTGWQGADNPVVKFRYYSLDNITRMSGSYESASKTSLMEWNFSRFDSKSK